MNKNYFEVICDLILGSERTKKFDTKKEKNKIVLTNGDLGYEIVYNNENNQIILSAADVDSEERKALSSWLLDNDSANQKDAEMIAKDFIDAMVGQEKSAVKQQTKRKSSADESNITGLFFANRMVNIFPELKDEIQTEKECYIEFRPAIFAKEHILPKINELLCEEKEKTKINKLAKLLSDLYQNGNLDVRSVITMAILNNIENEVAVNNLKPSLSEELQKGWHAALKYKGKKVKPEKPKKKSSFISKALSAQQR